MAVAPLVIIPTNKFEEALFELEAEVIAKNLLDIVSGETDSDAPTA
jgi:hypothetical protein